MSEQLLRGILESQQLIIKTLQQHSKTLEHHGTQLESLQKGQLRLETRIESEVIEKIRGLYDDREVQQDTNQRITSTLERIEAKVDVLQMETAHVRRVK